jgi:uncharacterized protein YijF (DUF1287 family)
MGGHRKIILSLSTVVESVDAKSIEVDDELMESATKESRWQLGIAVINGAHRKVERRLNLDEYIYRMDGHILNPDCIEAWQATEYIDWRDK